MRGVIREVFHPPLFSSTLPWRPLILEFSAGFGGPLGGERQHNSKSARCHRATDSGLGTDIFDSSKRRQYCDHQNTKPLQTRKYTPKYTPDPPPKNRNTEKKKNEKYTKIDQFPIFFLFFLCSSFLEGDFGVYFGVNFSGLDGFCILYGGHMIAAPIIVFSAGNGFCHFSGAL